jgi:hypothetical protein
MGDLPGIGPEGMNMLLYIIIDKVGDEGRWVR